MKLKTKRERIRSNVDMTPMIDIVFQLILFFLVSTTFATLPGIKLNLPQSHTSEHNYQGLRHRERVPVSHASPPQRANPRFLPESCQRGIFTLFIRP